MCGRAKQPGGGSRTDRNGPGPGAGGCTEWTLSSPQVPLTHRARQFSVYSEVQIGVSWTSRGRRLALWSAQRACSCSDHQAFACSCMQGRGRKLVAIQTQSRACQQEAVRSAARTERLQRRRCRRPSRNASSQRDGSLQRPDCGRNFVLLHSRQQTSRTGRELGLQSWGGCPFKAFCFRNCKCTYGAAKYRPLACKMRLKALIAVACACAPTALALLAPPATLWQRCQRPSSACSPAHVRRVAASPPSPSRSVSSWRAWCL
jgi:hypothetical protein